MQEPKPFRGADVRSHNNSLFLKVLWTRGSLSRADIAKITGLSRPSTSDIIQKLLTMGLVSEIGLGSSSGGRPPILLRFEDDARSVAGISIRDDGAEIVLMNLRGKILGKESISLSNAHRPTRALEAIKKSLGKMMTLAEAERLMGIGIGLPGNLETSDFGLCLKSDLLSGWSKINLPQLFSEHFDVPCFFERDVVLGGLSSYWFSLEKIDKSSILFVDRKTLRSSLILEGSAVRGSQGLLGEKAAFLKKMGLSMDQIIASLRTILDPGSIVMGGEGKAIQGTTSAEYGDFHSAMGGGALVISLFLDDFEVFFRGSASSSAK